MIKAWYFANDGNRLGYNDNRLVRVGITHTVDCKPVSCQQGLHASERIIDALQYASYHVLYRVQLDGEMDMGEDKISAQSRTYLARYDCKKILLEFARKQALINIEKIQPYCSSDEYTLIVKWLNTGDKSLQSAARSAAGSAESAARSAAARSAAWSAESAAWLAARSAESAVRSAAWSAAWLAARSAVAWSAAWSAAEDILIQMIKDKYGDIDD